MTNTQAELVAGGTTTGRSRTVIRTPRQAPSRPRSASQQARSARPRASILPTTDVFSIRGNGPASAFSAIVRFLVLFALFTAAGSALLLMRSADRSSVTGSSETRPGATDQAAALPVAAGPAGVGQRLDWDLPEAPTASRPHAQTPPVTESTGDQATVNDDTPAMDDSAVLPYPTTTAYPPPSPPGAAERLLPQVRTTDQPPAVARLPGYILEAPLHQAHDDRHEPRLH